MMALRETSFISRLVHIFKKGKNMDIDKLQKMIADVKSVESPRWSSSKLWVTVGLIGGLIWLANSAIQTIIWPITILASIWLISRTIEGIFEGKNKTEVKKAIAKSNKDLTEEEISTLTK
jgi:hypothetical protein